MEHTSRLVDMLAWKRLPNDGFWVTFPIVSSAMLMQPFLVHASLIYNLWSLPRPHGMCGLPLARHVIQQCLGYGPATCIPMSMYAESYSSTLGPNFFCMANAKVLDNLSTHGHRTSAVITLTKLSRNITITALEWSVQQLLKMNLPFG